MVNSLREVEAAAYHIAFDWARDYAPYWTGPDGSFEDIVFGPDPDDVYVLNGVRATHRDHMSGEARLRAVRTADLAQQRYNANNGQIQNAMVQNELNQYRNALLQAQSMGNPYGELLNRGRR